MSIKLEQSEEIIHIAKKHMIVYMAYWLLAFFFIVAPFFFMFWLFGQGIWGQIAFFGALFIGLVILIRTIFLWNKNSAIITTHRVVDIEQRGFFDKTVTEIPYSELDFVAGKIKGIGGTILRYGTVIINNQAGTMSIVLEKVKHPVRLQEKINKYKKSFNAVYSDKGVCLNCNSKRNSIFEIIDKKIKKSELEELIKIKRAIDIKISKLLENNNDI
ncbi:MAG: hypothetical protein A2725_04070 [Candidatus Magasanikbacteria bacterium RIFCSPHIGHO2_01_FULL_33_34]|uniref:DUF304 domain-containing protein n=1 Tax=Candidatus Magasanikbacteria bacterium RIFCSPHIGHO2_01_FULL_33_34 TaxID=1798671 RepID=A0A1F6LHS9_9BACT|nr:MAG: hypothetical protein A2725_04070 [Candidatus Magasanikbacteria bacterium RIFCSPHIGHO2_01_FULL_33_34]OGH65144.1 MAG: hypothetical protein A3B83_03830 [Candidatus Magasanikbacteria bacterium RIFCSPHIGHO2_02_FULL_33_17]OGH75312.1 MAG: hypothetical protein A3A89_04335 [Candidatus Magasanikbacteria bacterium RIFCSPLOWO2_01_FULL_33_34]OGH81711.1 MAG: hypothetical protein A3F93_03105 [Candidatus Magasanikbacteria bacterium RIFCSPLOWO2_12_FULL_34_7]